MIPRGLAAAVAAGAAASAALGLAFHHAGDGEQLVFVDGPSVSIVTGKTDFGRGEPVEVRIVNSGGVPLEFDGPSYGLRVVQLDGIELYSPAGPGGPAALAPGESASLVWDQTKSGGGQALHGRYKLVTSATAPGQGEVRSSVAIDILG